MVTRRTVNLRETCPALRVPKFHIPRKTAVRAGPRIVHNFVCFYICRFNDLYEITEITKMTCLLLAFSRSSYRPLASAILIVMLAGQTLATESLEQTVNYLIDHVAKSDATFIRNGVSHTPAEAVAHIKAKYEHFKNQITTPEDFSRLTASKRLLTGKPYLVRAPNGKETRARCMADRSFETISD